MPTVAVSLSDLSNHFLAAYIALQSNEARIVHGSSQSPEPLSVSHQLLHSKLCHILHARNNDPRTSTDADTDFRQSVEMEREHAYQTDRELSNGARQQPLQWHQSQAQSLSQSQSQPQPTVISASSATTSPAGGRDRDSGSGGNGHGVPYPDHYRHSLPSSPPLLPSSVNDPRDEFFRAEFRRLLRDHDQQLRAKDLEHLHEKEFLLKEIKRLCHERDRELVRFSEDRKKFTATNANETSGYLTEIAQLRAQLSQEMDNNRVKSNECAQLLQRCQALEIASQRGESELRRLQLQRADDIELFQSQIEQLAAMRARSELAAPSPSPSLSPSPSKPVAVKMQLVRPQPAHSSHTQPQRTYHHRQSPPPPATSSSPPPTNIISSPASPSRHLSLQELAAVD